MSENDWTFKGYSYLVDGEISVTKKNEYDYLWFEQATDEKNNPVNISGYERRVEILNQMEHKWFLPDLRLKDMQSVSIVFTNVI